MKYKAFAKHWWENEYEISKETQLGHPCDWCYKEFRACRQNIDWIYHGGGKFEFNDTECFVKFALRWS